MVNILIVGVTGSQGGAVAARLRELQSQCEEPIQLYALTRNTTSPTASKLEKDGFNLVQGDLNDPDSIKTALKNIHRVFLVTIPHGKGGAEAEATAGKNFIALAKKANVQHVVFTSVDSADRKTEVPHFESKYTIENELKASGIPWTIVRPVAFMENFPIEKGLGRSLAFGFFQAALGNKPMQIVSVVDIGYVAAEALLDPRKYEGETISLAGDELTIDEVRKVYDKVLYGGKPLAGKVWLPSFVVWLLPYDWRKMFQFLRQRGYNVDIPALKARYGNIHSFQEFLAKKTKAQ